MRKLAIVLALMCRPALGCECIDASGPTALDAMRKADVVIAGVVQPDWRFKVMQVWKTDVLRRTEEIGFSGSNCDYYFEPGAAYLVFANRDGRALRTTICSKTSRLICASKYLAQLGRPFKMYEAFSTSILIDREQPYSLHTPCLEPPRLSSSRNLSIPAWCVLGVDATIDRDGKFSLREFKKDAYTECAANLTAVATTLSTWKFRPATLFGKAVAVKVDHITMHDPMTEEEYAEWQASQKQNKRRY